MSEPFDIERRRNFNALLILANVFRVMSYFIVGLSALFVVAAIAASLVSRQPDTLLQLIAGSAGVLVYGLGLFLGSELIRLLVGIGKDIARMSGREEPRPSPSPQATSPAAAPRPGPPA